jgi:uncharacterized protein (DUF302 family)
MNNQISRLSVKHPSETKTNETSAEMTLLKAVEDSLNDMGLDKPTVHDMMNAIDSTDLDFQIGKTKDLIHTDFQSRADALRHRADMMRRRAEEFDEMADIAEKVREKAISDLKEVNDMDKNIQLLLAEHAHIKPRRV